MEKLLIAIENDLSLDRADYTRGFIRKYDGEVIVMTGFRNKSDKEIYNNVSKCTDIAVQTCFVNGSDNQLDEMVGLLSKIPHTINVYIAYIGGDSPTDLYDYFVKYITPSDLLSIKQHNVFSMGRNVYDSLPFEEHTKLDFTSVTKKLSNRKAYIQEYKDTAPSRPTGRKVKILCCNAFAKAFENLPIGETVDELECSELLEGKKSARGVWIMGNGEPVMLVNDAGVDEYKLVNKLSPKELIIECAKLSYFDIKMLNETDINEMIEAITSTDSDTAKANYICEYLGVEKRGNRERFRILLAENLEIA